MTYTNVQNTAGTRVTAGTQPWSVSKQYASNVTTGNMLVAIVSRVATVNSPPTVGQVSDDQGNPWHQAVECSNSHYGVDMWVCESCVATGNEAYGDSSPGRVPEQHHDRNQYPDHGVQRVFRVCPGGPDRPGHHHHHLGNTRRPTTT